MDKTDVVCTHTHTHNGILLSHKKDETLPFAATWMYPKNIMLREVSQTEKTNTVWYHSYVESKAENKELYVCVFSCDWLFVTPWTVARQASLSIGFSRQEYWSGLPFPPPRNLPHPGTEPTSPSSPALAGGFFTTWATWEVQTTVYSQTKIDSQVQKREKKKQHQKTLVVPNGRGKQRRGKEGVKLREVNY